MVKIKSVVIKADVNFGCAINRGDLVVSTSRLISITGIKNGTI